MRQFTSTRLTQLITGRSRSRTPATWTAAGWSPSSQERMAQESRQAATPTGARGGDPRAGEWPCRFPRSALASLTLGRLGGRRSRRPLPRRRRLHRARGLHAHAAPSGSRPVPWLPYAESYELSITRLRLDIGIDSAL